jgi:YidC/Oxa1 family membrane protein insertase
VSFLRSWREHRRWKRLPRDERSIVFYSESRQDWHHFEGILDRLTGELSRTVCYVTSDPEDPGLRRDHPRLRGFCIEGGFQLILFFQMLEADVMVLTMMDLDNFHLKRSKLPVHYVYLFHSMSSTHMLDLPNSYDHYDTLLCTGPHQVREIRKREEIYGLPAKRLLEHGYARIERLLAERDARAAGAARKGPVTVLVAPTWGDSSLLNVCGERVVAVLLDAGYRVILRPHYQTVKLTPHVVSAIRSSFAGHPSFEYVDRMGESESLFRSDILVCDWSAMAIEYALGLEKPVLSIDVPARVRNPEYGKLGLEPFEAAIRREAGVVLAPDRLGEAPLHVERLLASREGFARRMQALRETTVFNLGRSDEVAAAAIASIADDRASARRAR